MKDTVHPVDEVINKMKEVEGFGGFVICNNDGVVLRHENLGAADKLGIHLCGNQPVSRVHPTNLHTKSFLGDDVVALAPASGEESASPRHRAGVASMAWRTTRRFSTNAP